MADSLYLINSGIRDSIIQKEEQVKRNLERLQKAMEMKQEAKRLRDQVK